MACIAIAGCNSKPTPNGAVGPPPIAKSDADTGEAGDPCALIEPKEAEAALGAPLGTPPYRASSSTPDTEGKDCVYQTANFHTITVTVDFTDGAQDYQMTGFAKKLLSGAPSEAAKNAFKMDDGTEISGEWDEASLTAMNCCIFNALRGDQMITVDFTGSEATLPQAASLVDAAYKRIDKLLKLDGAANVAAATAFLKTRPKPVAACSVLSQAEVEAIVGPLISPPVASGSKSGDSSYCEYHVPPGPGGIPRAYEINIDWRGGYAAVRSQAHTVRLGGMAMGGASTKADDPLPAPAAPGDPWERAGMVYNDFVALKKDVEVKIDHRMLDDGKVKAMVAAAMRKF
jgi:hypothetical protein